MESNHPKIYSFVAAIYQEAGSLEYFLQIFLVCYFKSARVVRRCENMDHINLIRKIYDVNQKFYKQGKNAFAQIDKARLTNNFVNKAKIKLINLWKCAIL